LRIISVYSDVIYKITDLMFSIRQKMDKKIGIQRDNKSAINRLQESL